MNEAARAVLTAEIKSTQALLASTEASRAVAEKDLAVLTARAEHYRGLITQWTAALDEPDVVTGAQAAAESPDRDSASI